jgi:hypothetical protein
MNDLQWRIGISLVVSLVSATTAASGETAFTAKPMAVKEGDRVRISFAVAALTDVEVAVLDDQGRVVRHLAAGLLGNNAPEPFQPGSLAQGLVWDGRDDAGQPATGGPFQVRTRLGLRPRLDKILGRNDNTLSGDICALTTNPQGELFVLLAEPFRGRAELRVLDRQGSYLRTIMPYPADTPEARTEPVGHVKIDGRRQPLVFNGQGHCFYPLVAGLRGQTMAWHPDGYLLAASAIGSMCNHGPPRHLLAFHPEGGAPEKTGFVGPQIRQPRGFLGGAGEGYAIGMDRLAVSQDGQWIYLVQDMKRAYFEKGERHHGVYRVRWTDKELGDLWLGRKEPGAGDEEFDDPQGLAVDQNGRLFVCDRGNGRVKVYAPGGQRPGAFAVPDPEQFAVSSTSGEVYVLCRKGMRSWDRLRRIEYDHRKEMAVRAKESPDTADRPPLTALCTVTDLSSRRSRSATLSPAPATGRRPLTAQRSAHARPIPRAVRSRPAQCDFAPLRRAGRTCAQAVASGIRPRIPAFPPPATVLSILSRVLPTWF